MEKPKIVVSGVEFEWDLDRALMLIWGQPVVCMWVGSVMAGFMSALQKSSGTERFNLAVESAGRDSVEAEWTNIILPSPTPEEGIAFAGQASGTVGLGGFELLSIDRGEKVARFRARNSWESLYQKSLGVCWGTRSLAGKLAGYCGKVFDTYCWAEQTAFIALGDEYDEFIIRPSDRTIEGEIESLVVTGKATNADLAGALEKLRHQVHERKAAEATSAELTVTLDQLRREVEDRRAAEERLTREIQDRKAAEERLIQEIEERREVEQELRVNLDIIKRQEEAIREMSTPILELWEGILTMPVIGRVDSARAAQMMEQLLHMITLKRARLTILDLTGVEIVDSDAANHVLRLVRAAALLGTRCVVSGISARMAHTIIGSGVDLSEIATFGTLEAALRHAIAQIADSRSTKSRT